MAGIMNPDQRAKAIDHMERQANAAQAAMVKREANRKAVNHGRALYICAEVIRSRKARGRLLAGASDLALFVGAREVLL